MHTLTYQLSPLHSLFGTMDSNSLVMDMAENKRHLQALYLQSLINSGDYFKALAIELDSICAEVQENDVATVELQRVIRDLLYIQSEYQIVKK